MTGRRTGDLSNADELARIIADVEGTADNEFRGLLWKLEQARKGEAEGDAPRYRADTLPAIADLWEASWTPADGRAAPIKPRTQDAYRKSLRPIRAWMLLPKNRDRAMRALPLPAIMKFLDGYDDRPSQRAALKRCISALFSFALIGGHGGVTTHPFGVTPRLRRRHRTRKRAVGLWSPETVDLYANKAATAPLPFAEGPRVWKAGARLVRLMWQTSADQTDVVTWRRDRNFRDGPQPAIVYTRGKLGEGADQIVTPISQALAEELRTCGEIFFVTDPFGRPYAADDVHSDNQRGGHFRALQEAVIDDGGPRLVLDHLRHSAITDAVAKGARVGDVPSLSGHRDTRMIEQIYLQLTEGQALSVQRARGIID